MGVVGSWAGPLRALTRTTPAKPVKKFVDIDGELTGEAARDYIPDVPGCRIVKDTKLHMRWTVPYPRAEPPKSTSKAFGTSDDRSALFHCLRWVWTVHHECTGQECPFELE